MTDTSPAAVEHMAEYYTKWAADIRTMNGPSVDADHADTTALTLRALSAQLTAANQRAAASVEAVARANAERDDLKRAKECFQRKTLAHWQALCAMRNTINEYIPMPNTDSGPLFSPEDGPIYADIAERVVARLKADREYVLAINQELKDRTQKAEAERDALVAAAYEAAAQEVDTAGDPAVTEALGQRLCCSGHDCGCHGADVGTFLLHHILALTPPHATAALDRIKAEARADGYAHGVRDAAERLRMEEGTLISRRVISAILSLPDLPAPAVTVQKIAGNPLLQAQFADWFRRNYPGPDTIIGNPDWHAPRLLNAAIWFINNQGAIAGGRDE